MNKREYFAQIEAWERIYGKPQLVPIETDPTRCMFGCDKCGKIKRKMSRHHVANDFMFAMLLPDIYAERYIQFHPEDVRRLCDRCHRAVHLVYANLLGALDAELKVITRRGGATKEWCEKWKARFRELYEAWRLVTKQKKRKKNGTRPGVQGWKRGKRVRSKSLKKRHIERRSNRAHGTSWPPDGEAGD